MRFSVDGVVVRADGRELPALWLRERTTDPLQLDPVSTQRLFDPHQLDPDLAITDASLVGTTLRVRFSDGHATTFGTALLGRQLDHEHAIPVPTPWTAQLGKPPEHAWPSVEHDDAALRGALEDFLRLGVVVLTGAPTTPGSIEAIAARFGHIRETNFGRIFDVRSVHRANDLAYTGISLGPHTDNPYRHPVPGVQLLHCLVNETAGGESTLVDSLSAVAELRAEDDRWFEVLATTPVQFRFLDPDTDLRAVRTLIERDATGAVTGVNYSPRLDHMPLMSPAATRTYQAARRRLAELLVAPHLQVRFMLEPGCVEVFANDRVLHGRSAFDPGAGLRHLQGCYIDGDAPRSRYRVLTQRSH